MTTASSSRAAQVASGRRVVYKCEIPIMKMVASELMLCIKRISLKRLTDRYPDD